jgi:histidine ammonia-lyase
VHVVDRLIEFLNRGLHPVMPEKGSVGASGDLAPLAHLAGALCGYGEAAIIYKGERLTAPEALKRAGLPQELELGAKDASALLNGSTVSLALATLSSERARRLLKHADIALALSLEAMRGEQAAFDSRLARARPHRGQIRTADNMRKILEGSERMSDASRALRFPEERRAPDAAPTPRVQDTYSMRCAPQVHGPVADALDYIEGIVTTELNSATDNPLMFENERGGYDVLSGGHFHGQYIAQAMDLLAMAITDLGSISERRVARLIDPSMSYGLPRNLSSGRLGVNTGFATVQCSLSALVMENKTLSMPGSVDSIPGKGNAEDHVSNATWCARKAATIVDNAEYIIAGEILTAAQALDMVPEEASRFPIGRGSAAALGALRKTIPPVLDGDVWYAAPMAATRELVRAGVILSAVEHEVGVLN